MTPTKITDTNKTWQKVTTDSWQQAN